MGVIEQKAEMVNTYFRRLYPDDYMGAQTVYGLKQVRTESIYLTESNSVQN